MTMTNNTFTFKDSDSDIFQVSGIQRGAYGTYTQALTFDITIDGDDAVESVEWIADDGSVERNESNLSGRFNAEVVAAIHEHLDAWLATSAAN